MWFSSFLLLYLAISGDLCYEEEDGSLVVVERLKELIKHNGIRVSRGLRYPRSDISPVNIKLLCAPDILL